MQFQYTSLALLSILFSTSPTIAIPASIPALSRLSTTGITTPSNPQIAAAAEPASSAPQAAEPAPQANGTASGAACAAAVNSLALGIEANIADQNNELTTVAALGNVLAQNPMDMTLYAATQTSLLGFVTKGITIRENNQRIAPSGNAALPGLAVVAMAQMEELNLTMSLAVPSTGIVDQAAANRTVETLKMDFAGGIKKNMENLMMATGGCKVVSNATTAVGGVGGEEGSREAKPMPGMAPGMEMEMRMGMKKVK